VVSHVRATGGLQLLSGPMSVAPNGGNGGVSRVASINSAAQRFDLTDNKLVVTNAAIGDWNDIYYTGVSGLIDAGRGNTSNAQWTGNGIVTSDTRAVNNNDLCSIGIAMASQVKGIAPTATTTWAGQTVQGDDVLVMFTWGGDANLDGKINIDDYGQIDFNVGSPGAYGWFNGDFNYDGKINIDDYGIIDFNVTAQTGVFPTGDGLDGAVAVPEPASAAGLMLAGLAAGRRRRFIRERRPMRSARLL
jgi:hypothetical protein